MPDQTSPKTRITLRPITPFGGIPICLGTAAWSLVIDPMIWGFPSVSRFVAQ
ncbi:hypothetical protein [Yoonia sp. SS1-5]|uniref:Uncharacterized protein n=1 Tax=Yoonia rhodophyticola TaxID=3137370 RepID=A0AAN0MKX2_9RHOB